MGFNAPTNTYDTFTDLRLAIGQSSSSVSVIGKLTITDQGGGQFYWNDTSTDNDDDQDVIKPTVSGSNPGRWIRFDKKNLQEVTDFGNTTTNEITAYRYVANGIDTRPGINPAAFIAERTMSPAVDTDATGFRDFTIFGRTGRGYCSFDALPTVLTGSHYTAYQSRSFVQGNVGDVQGYWSWIIHQAGTVNTFVDFTAGKGDITPGTVINYSAGLVIEDNRPGTVKHAIISYDPACPSVHAGKMKIGAATDPTDTLEVVGNTTITQSLKVQGNITPGLTTLPTGINIGNNIIAAGGTGNQDLNFGTRNDGRFIFQPYGTSFGNPVAEFKSGPVIGEPAQASNQFATLAQVQSFGLPFENYSQYTSVSTTGPDAVIFVDQDNSPSGDNTESQFFRHNNKLFYIATVEQ